MDSTLLDAVANASSDASCQDAVKQLRAVLPAHRSTAAAAAGSSNSSHDTGTGSSRITRLLDGGGAWSWPRVIEVLGVRLRSAASSAALKMETLRTLSEAVTCGGVELEQPLEAVLPSAVGCLTSDTLRPAACTLFSALIASVANCDAVVEALLTHGLGSTSAPLRSEAARAMCAVIPAPLVKNMDCRRIIDALAGHLRDPASVVIDAVLRTLGFIRAFDPEYDRHVKKLRYAHQALLQEHSATITSFATQAKTIPSPISTSISSSGATGEPHAPFIGSMSAVAHDSGGASGGGAAGAAGGPDSADKSGSSRHLNGGAPTDKAFGFLPPQLVGQLRSDKFETRCSAAEEVVRLLRRLCADGDVTVLFAQLASLMKLLGTLLSDTQYRIVVSGLTMVELVCTSCGPRIAPHVEHVLPHLVSRLGDPKITLRQPATRALSTLMPAAGANTVIPALLNATLHKNQLIREAAVKFIILALLTQTRLRPLDFDPEHLVKELGKLLFDTAPRVQLYATEALAVIVATNPSKSLNITALLATVGVDPSSQLALNVSRRLADGSLSLPAVNDKGEVDMPAHVIAAEMNDSPSTSEGSFFGMEASHMGPYRAPSSRTMQRHIPFMSSLAGGSGSRGGMPGSVRSSIAPGAFSAPPTPLSTGPAAAAAAVAAASAVVATPTASNFGTYVHLPAIDTSSMQSPPSLMPPPPSSTLSQPSSRNLVGAVPVTAPTPLSTQTPRDTVASSAPIAITSATRVIDGPILIPDDEHQDFARYRLAIGLTTDEVGASVDGFSLESARDASSSSYQESTSTGFGRPRRSTEPIPVSASAPAYVPSFNAEGQRRMVPASGIATAEVSSSAPGFNFANLTPLATGSSTIQKIDPASGPLSPSRRGGQRPRATDNGPRLRPDGSSREVEPVVGNAGAHLVANPLDAEDGAGVGPRRGGPRAYSAAVTKADLETISATTDPLKVAFSAMAGDQRPIVHVGGASASPDEGNEDDDDAPEIVMEGRAASGTPDLDPVSAKLLLLKKTSASRVSSRAASRRTRRAVSASSRQETQSQPVSPLRARLAEYGYGEVQSGASTQGPPSPNDAPATDPYRGSLTPVPRRLAQPDEVDSPQTSAPLSPDDRPIRASGAYMFEQLDAAAPSTSPDEWFDASAAGAPPLAAHPPSPRSYRARPQQLSRATQQRQAQREGALAAGAAAGSAAGGDGPSGGVTPAPHPPGITLEGFRGGTPRMRVNIPTSSRAGVPDSAPPSSEDLYTDTPDLPVLPTPERAARSVKASLDLSQEWNVQFNALNTVRSLAVHHAADLKPYLKDVLRAVLALADSLRSQVARNAVKTLSNLFDGCGKALDPSLETLIPPLLKKTADTLKVLAEDADNALSSMVANCTDTRVLSVLVGCTSGQHDYIRSKCGKYLVALVQQMGPERVATCQQLDALVIGAVNLLKEGSGEPRQYGRELVVQLNKWDLLVGGALERLGRSDRELVEKAQQMASHVSRSGVASAGRRVGSARRGGATPSAIGGRISAMAESPAGEQFSKLKEQLSSTDWRAREEGLRQLVVFAAAETAYFDVVVAQSADLLTQRVGDGNTKVQLAAVQCLQGILGSIGKSLEPAIPQLLPPVASLAAAGASRLATMASQCIDTILNTIEPRVWCPVLQAQIVHGKDAVRPFLLNKLAGRVESLSGSKPLIVRFVIPCIFGCLDDTKADVRVAVGMVGKAVAAAVGDAVVYEEAQRAKFSPAQLARLRQAVGSQ